MNKVIGVTDLQRRFRAIFDEVVKENTPYVLTRGSRPEAALIPYDDYLRFQEMQESEVLANFDRLLNRMAEKNAQYSLEEIVADIEAVREEIANEKSVN
jgi:prevent-host-death family protein